MKSAVQIRKEGIRYRVMVTDGKRNRYRALTWRTISLTRNEFKKLRATMNEIK